MTGRKKIFSFIAVVVIVFAGVCALNFLTHYASDDYRYHFFYSSSQDNIRWLSGIGDIPLSMWNHYNLWGGRIVAHSIVQFFALFDKSVFNIFNSLIYVVLGLILYLHIDRDVKKWKPLFLILIYALIWLWIPQFGTSVLWMSGSCNYLWMSVLLLLFLLPYRSHAERQNKRKWNGILTVVMIPLGLLSGCTNENGGGAVIFLGLLFIGIWVWKKIKIPFWSIAGILTACLGFLFLIAAPGNGKREGIGMIEFGELLRRLRELAGFSYHAVFIPGVIFILLFCYIKARKKITFWQCVRECAVPISYVLAGAASVAVLVMSPIIAARSWMFAVCFLIIADGILFLDILQNFEWSMTTVKRGTACVVIVCFGIYGAAFLDIRDTYRQINREIREIEEQKEAGISDITVTKFEATENPYNAFSKTRDLSWDREDTFNVWMARFYDVDTIGIYAEDNEE